MKLQIQMTGKNGVDICEKCTTPIRKRYFFQNISLSLCKNCVCLSKPGGPESSTGPTTTTTTTTTG